MQKKESYWLVATLAVIFISLLLLSCKPEKTIKEENETLQLINKTLPAGLCQPHWECADDDYRRHQLENCTWLKPEKCERGCFDGTCRAAPTCAVGFKCIDEKRRAYQKEDCSYLNKIPCEWGCEEGKCKEKPANATAANETAAYVPVPTAPTTSYAVENEEGQVEEEDKIIYSLKLGEQQEIEISGTKHNVSIYNLEAGRVILKVDGIKSEWIEQDGNFTYGNIGATFHVQAVLFQTYGTKAVDFTVS